MKVKILSFLRRKIPYKEISKRIGCSLSTISYHARRNGFGRESVRRYKWGKIQTYHDAGHSRIECLRKFGIGHSTWQKAKERSDIQPRDFRKSLNTYLVKGKRLITSGNHLKKRLIDAGLLKFRCRVCGLSKWRGKPISLQLDHKNGDGTDNRLKNLRLLCPNCHSQTPTYAGKNKGRYS